MTKISFKNDYSEGAHPLILDALIETNMKQTEGYGEDIYCLAAADLIRQTAQNPDLEIQFLSGGTQANLVCLSSLLKPYQAVIAAESAHINVHEAGAIEATGHKICYASSPDGKLTPTMVQAIVDFHTDEHMVQPKAVFISNATEVGTAYTLAELEGLREVCDRNKLYLYMDGARLGVGLTYKGCDLTLKDVARLVDVFYIGGTKNGALIGEAVVFANQPLARDFRFYMKQHGGLLAKGRLLGIQFKVLFENGLFFELASHATSMAQRIRSRMLSLGIPFLTDSTTNQIFPILPDTVIEQLLQKYGFYVWSKAGEDISAVRLVTSWATQPEVIDQFLKDFEFIYS